MGYGVCRFIFQYPDIKYRQFSFSNNPPDAINQNHLQGAKSVHIALDWQKPSEAHCQSTPAPRGSFTVRQVVSGISKASRHFSMWRESHLRICHSDKFWLFSKPELTNPLHPLRKEPKACCTVVLQLLVSVSDHVKARRI